MLLTTLLYIESQGSYLMMHRVKKENDCNRDKWIGIGGKFLEGESPEECIRREAAEETGLTLGAVRFRGVVTFVSDAWESEQMFLFTCSDFRGTPGECAEGTLEWVPKEKVASLPIWEGDRIFLRLLDTALPPFLLKLRYEGEHLAEAVLNGRTMPV